jgi:HAD superfamily hydrolase (TIGR01450 family)
VLTATDRPLVETHDLLVLDLDGVVSRGHQAVQGAAAALDAARSAHVAIAFVTNNAARTPAAVAEHLARLGVRAEPRDVVTSAQAAVRLLAQRVQPGSEVYVIGGEGLIVALEERGLRAVTDVAALGDGRPAAVVQGYGPDVPWQRVVDGAILVRDGVPWVASNTDLTIPTDRGLGPGNGTLVRLISEYAGRRPEVAGKPEPALFEETLDRVGGSRPLVVGDRLDTDIAGAVRLGWDSLLVMTGVTGLAELAAAPVEERPTYLGADLGVLHEPQTVPRVEGETVSLEDWRATVAGGRLVIEGSGSVGAWWRVAALATWAHLDSTGREADTTAVTPPSR